MTDKDKLSFIQEFTMKNKIFKVQVEITEYDGHVFATGEIRYRGLFADTAMQRAFITHDRLYGYGGKYARFIN